MSSFTYLIITVLIYFIWKSKFKKKKHPPEIDSNIGFNETFFPTRESRSVITIHRGNTDNFKSIYDLLCNMITINYMDLERELTKLFLINRVEIKEINNFIKTHKEEYSAKIEKLKEINNWVKLGEKDRLSIMDEFRAIAIKEFNEELDNGSYILFEEINDGYDNVKAIFLEYNFLSIFYYMNLKGKIGKVVRCYNDDFRRKWYEKINDVGLALRGKQISNEELLYSLTLKELNKILGNPEKPYRRKQIAIEAISSEFNIDEIVDKNIPTREYFKLLPFPDRFRNIDVGKIEQTIKYNIQYARILVDIYIEKLQI